MIGMPFVSPPENIRLPGPHYILENVHTAQEKDDERRSQKSASLADEYFKKAGAAKEYELANKDLKYIIGPPEMPFGLSQVRAASEMYIPVTSAEELYGQAGFGQIDLDALEMPPFGLPETDSIPQQPFVSQPSFYQTSDPNILQDPSVQLLFPSQPQSAEMFIDTYSETAPDSGPNPRFNIPYRG